MVAASNESGPGSIDGIWAPELHPHQWCAWYIHRRRCNGFSEAPPAGRTMFVLDTTTTRPPTTGGEGLSPRRLFSDLDATTEGRGDDGVQYLGMGVVASRHQHQSVYRQDG